MVRGVEVLAPVQWWDAKNVAVQCPYCHDTHRHGFGGGPLAYDDMDRLSHCRDGAARSYKLAFPFDTSLNEARYEINKDEGRFESSKFRMIQSSDEVATLAPRQTRPKFSDGTQRTVFGKDYENCDIEFAISACINGDVHRVQEFLKRFHGTADYEIFLHGENAQGNTALCLAAMETSRDMVALLLELGSDVNAQNQQGRTPLMEAALWARAEIVEILVENYADKTLRDHAGKLAFDLAQPSKENDRERDGRVRNHKEKYQDRRSREHIALWLGEPQTQGQLFDIGASSDESPRYVVNDERIALVTPIMDLSDTVGPVDGWNYVAVLDRGRGFPVVRALSRTIDGVRETKVHGHPLSDLVAKIASVVCNVQKPVSKYHAAHGETQLLAYFVDKHVFFPDEAMGDGELDAYLDWVEQYGASDDEQGAEERRRYSVAQLIRSHKLSTRHRCATIVSNSNPCVDCEEFCRLVNKRFDLELSLQYGNKGDARTLSIANLGTLCTEMCEAAPLCRSILLRLESHLGTDSIVVQSTEVASAVVENPRVVSVAALFDTRLKQFGNKHIVLRLAAARSAVKAYEELHVALDRLDDATGISGQVQERRLQWDIEVTLMKKRLADQLAGRSRSELISAFPDSNAMNEALMQLSYEIEKHEREYSADELDLLANVSKCIYNKATAPVLIKWFIPSHTVQVTTNRLGKGSFGKVFEGEWRKTKVAVKYVEVQDDMASFRREVEIWSECRSQYVVSFIGACHVSSPSPFIVCEFASNGTLRKYLYEQRSLGKSLEWRKLYDVSRGLHFFHENKFIHRDLKGDNILVAEDGTAKLADFGLSFEQSSSLAIVKKWGAIQWRSPECLLGKELGYASDVYSLGMCIVEAVTGEVPWGSDEVVRGYLQHKTFMAQPRGICDSGWELVKRMCEFEPSARITLAHVVDELKRLAGEEEEHEKANTGAAVSPSSLLSPRDARSSTEAGFMSQYMKSC